MNTLSQTPTLSRLLSRITGALLILLLSSGLLRAGWPSGDYDWAIEKQLLATGTYGGNTATPAQFAAALDAIVVTTGTIKIGLETRAVRLSDLNPLLSAAANQSSEGTSAFLAKVLSSKLLAGTSPSLSGTVQALVSTAIAANPAQVSGSNGYFAQGLTKLAGLGGATAGDINTLLNSCAGASRSDTATFFASAVKSTKITSGSNVFTLFRTAADQNPSLVSGTGGYFARALDRLGGFSAVGASDVNDLLAEAAGRSTAETATLFGYAVNNSKIKTVANVMALYVTAVGKNGGLVSGSTGYFSRGLTKLSSIGNAGDIDSFLNKASLDSPSEADSLFAYALGSSKITSGSNVFTLFDTVVQNNPDLLAGSTGYVARGLAKLGGISTTTPADIDAFFSKAADASLNKANVADFFTQAVSNSKITSVTAVTSLFDTAMRKNDALLTGSTGYFVRALARMGDLSATTITDINDFLIKTGTTLRANTPEFFAQALANKKVVSGSNVFTLFDTAVGLKPDAASVGGDAGYFSSALKRLGTVGTATDINNLLIKVKPLSPDDMGDFFAQAVNSPKVSMAASVLTLLDTATRQNGAFLSGNNGYFAKSLERVVGISGATVTDVSNLLAYAAGSDAGSAGDFFDRALNNGRFTTAANVATLLATVAPKNTGLISGSNGFLDKAIKAIDSGTTGTPTIVNGMFGTAAGLVPDKASDLLAIALSGTSIKKYNDIETLVKTGIAKNQAQLAVDNGYFAQGLAKIAEISGSFGNVSTLLNTAGTLVKTDRSAVSFLVGQALNSTLLTTGSQVNALVKASSTLNPLAVSGTVSAIDADGVFARALARLNQSDDPGFSAADVNNLVKLATTGTATKSSVVDFFSEALRQSWSKRISSAEQINSLITTAYAVDKTKTIMPYFLRANGFVKEGMLGASALADLVRNCVQLEVTSGTSVLANALANEVVSTGSNVSQVVVAAVNSSKSASNAASLNAAYLNLALAKTGVIDTGAKVVALVDAVSKANTALTLTNFNVGIASPLVSGSNNGTVNDIADLVRVSMISLPALSGSFVTLAVAGPNSGLVSSYENMTYILSRALTAAPQVADSLVSAVLVSAVTSKLSFGIVQLGEDVLKALDGRASAATLTTVVNNLTLADKSRETALVQALIKYENSRGRDSVAAIVKGAAMGDKNDADHIAAAAAALSPADKPDKLTAIKIAVRSGAGITQLSGTAVDKIDAAVDTAFLVASSTSPQDAAEKTKLMVTGSYSGFVDAAIAGSVIAKPDEANIVVFRVINSGSSFASTNASTVVGSALANVGLVERSNSADRDAPGAAGVITAAAINAVRAQLGSSTSAAETAVKNVVTKAVSTVLTLDGDISLRGKSNVVQTGTSSWFTAASGAAAGAVAGVAQRGMGNATTASLALTGTNWNARMLYSVIATSMTQTASETEKANILRAAATAAIWVAGDRRGITDGGSISSYWTNDAPTGFREALITAGVNGGKLSDALARAAVNAAADDVLNDRPGAGAAAYLNTGRSGTPGTQFVTGEPVTNIHEL